MLALSIQNLMEGYYNIGILQLVVALGFAFMLWRNIQMTRCERSGNCRETAAGVRFRRGWQNGSGKRKSDGTFFYLPLLLGTDLNDTRSR